MKNMMSGILKKGWIIERMKALLKEDKIDNKVLKSS